MEFESFYGGRKGSSYLIVKNYKTIQEMVNAFRNGGDYTTVNYDEHVIIDTENKNDPDNGKVFRRGYDYNNNMGGAIYVAQIVGPAGAAPHTEMHTIEEVKSIRERENFEYRKGEGSYAPVDNLIPGKYTESGVDKYNDEITWAYCSVRDINKKDSTAHIGFKFPYTVVEYEAESVDPFYNRDSDGENFKNTFLTERIDNGQHPFYEKWKIKVPKGIKGDCLKNFRVVVANSEIESYPTLKEDIENQREVVVYDHYDYSTRKEGIRKTYYLGQYNMIEDITISEKGLITIKYTYDENDSYQLAIPVKTEIDNRYHLMVTYANNSTPKDLGYIGNGEVGAIVAKESDSAAKSLINELPPYSAWFIIEED